MAAITVSAVTTIAGTNMRAFDLAIGDTLNDDATVVITHGVSGTPTFYKIVPTGMEGTGDGAGGTTLWINTVTATQATFNRVQVANGVNACRVYFGIPHTMLAGSATQA